MIRPPNQKRPPPPTARDFVQQFADRFTVMYGRLLEQRDQLQAAGGPLHAFRGLKLRHGAERGIELDRVARDLSGTRRNVSYIVDIL